MTMKRRYKILLYTTIIMIIVIVVFVINCRPSFNLFTVLVQYPNGQQQITYWDNGTGQWYIFLPAGVETNNVYFIKQTQEEILMNGTPMSKITFCDEFAFEETCELTYKSYGKDERRGLTIIRSGGVPTLFLDTRSGNLEYIHANKDNKESGSVTLYTIEGELNYQSIDATISGRGNYTWLSSDKKSYSITLSQEADLLGMGSASEWILLSNSADPTHLRNKLVFDFADAGGMAYSPDSEWVSLYVNGEYRGLYLLCEKNEVQEERVGISQRDSFLVSLELEERLSDRNIDYFKTNADMTLRIHHPEVVDEQNLNNLNETWRMLEDSIASEDGYDPLTGRFYLDLIDLDSWARKYLIEEIFGNLDACFLSQYFYSESVTGDQKIYAGPVWDYDLSMGSDREWQMINPNALFANRLWVKGDIQSPWFYNLCQKEEFWAYVVAVYSNEYLPLLETFITVAIEDYAEQTMEASAADEIRWSDDSVAQKVYIEQLVQYLNKRIAFLNSYFIDKADYQVVSIDSATNGNIAYWLVEAGDYLPELPNMENTNTATFLGWYEKSSNQPFAPDEPITDDMELVAKWENKDQGIAKMIVKLIPLALIAVVGTILLTTELRRWRKYR